MPRRSGISDITYVYKENPNSITRSNNRNYKLYGLEGFATNMMWVVDELINRDVNNNTIRMTTLSSLVAGYYFYINLSENENVNMLYDWFKDIYNKYKEFKYTDNEIKECMRSNKGILTEKIDLNECISFNEFLKGFEV